MAMVSMLLGNDLFTVYCYNREHSNQLIHYHAFANFSFRHCAIRGITYIDRDRTPRVDKLDIQ